MKLRLRKSSPETFEQMRARIINETCDYINECLRHPELAERIPVVEAGKARFPRSLTQSFWGPLLRD